MSGVALVDSAHKDYQDYPDFPHGKTLENHAAEAAQPERTLRMPQRDPKSRGSSAIGWRACSRP